MAGPRFVGMPMPNQPQQQHDYGLQYQAHSLYQNGANGNNYHPHILQQQQQQYAQLQFPGMNHNNAHLHSPHQLQYYQQHPTPPVFHASQPTVGVHQLQQRAVKVEQDQNVQQPPFLDMNAGPSSSASHRNWTMMNADPSRMSVGTDWVDDDDDGAGSDNGGNSSQIGKDKDFFSCSHCDKTYKGKHARSIWRRHLQDKHGIPLSHQPRRTRWDADVNRPKNAEERRERMLESKRRWARKKRAMDKSEGKVKGEEDDSPESGMSPASVGASATVKKEAPAKVITKKEKKGAASSSSGADSTPNNSGAIPAPAISAQNNGGQTLAKQAEQAIPCGSEQANERGPWSFGVRPEVGSSSANPYSAGLTGSKASGAPLPSPRGTPDRRRGGHQSTNSMQFSPTAIGPPTSTTQIPLTTPSRLSAAHSSHSMSRSISMGSVGMNPNPFSLEHHKISPIASARPLSQARSTRDAMNSHARVLSLAGPSGQGPELAISPTRPSASRHSSLRGAFRSLLDTPNKHAMDDALLLTQNGSDGRFTLQNAKVSGNGSNAELGESAMKDEVRLGNSPLAKRQRITRAGPLQGSSDDEANGDGSLPSASFDSTSGDRQKRSRKPTSGDSGFDDSGLCLTGMTPFHKSIGRQLGGVGGTPASLSMLDSAFPQTVGRPTPFKRGHRKGKNSSADSLDLGDQRDTFSSPHHPNLAHSLGLAPQSALRTGTIPGVGTAGGVSSFDFGSLGASPFQHASMMGMSLGFTPWEKNASIAGRRDSVGSNWPDSIRKPLAAGLKLESGPRRSSSVPALDQDDDEGDEEDDDDEKASNAKGSPRGKENLDSSASKASRYHARIEDTPSRPSGKSRRGGSGIKRKNGDDEDEDDDEGTLYPLRFSAVANKKRAGTVDPL